MKAVSSGYVSYEVSHTHHRYKKPSEGLIDHHCPDKWGKTAPDVAVRKPFELW